MPTIDIVDLNRRKVGAAELRPEVFGVEVKTPVLADVVVMQAANRRQGSASTKTRSMVTGAGREPYKQNPTGRARAGSIRSTVSPHVAIVFGSHPSDCGDCGRT